MDPQLIPILGDLRRHASIFRLDLGAGSRALDLAVNGVLDHFDAQVDPDGRPWPELQSDYERWKSAHYPGNPIGVLEGLMRREIPGERSVSRDSAEWTYGSTDEARQEADWFTQGDVIQNRRPRPFADLNAGSISESDRLFDRIFEGGKV